jgi:hypothetical protein
VPEPVTAVDPEATVIVPVLVVTHVARELQLPVLKPTKFAAKPLNERHKVMMNGAAHFAAL